MSDILLSAKNLSVRFGGVLAVNDVSFDVKRGEVFTLIGPNGAGKTTVFNLISRIYTPTTGTIDYAGPQGMLRLTEQPPHRIASLGIARTFQNIELFEHATVLQNLLVGRHCHMATNVLDASWFFGRARREELERRLGCTFEFRDFAHFIEVYLSVVDLIRTPEDVRLLQDGLTEGVAAIAVPSWARCSPRRTTAAVPLGRSPRPRRAADGYGTSRLGRELHRRSCRINRH